MFITKSFRKPLVIASLMFPVMVQAVTVSQPSSMSLTGFLTAVNQDDSDPRVVTDPDGIVPTTASGTVLIQLDTVANTLDFNLTMDGIFQSALRNFGPNAAPVHLHLAGGGGNFGPIAVDLSLGAVTNDFIDTKGGDLNLIAVESRFFWKIKAMYNSECTLEIT